MSKTLKVLLLEDVDALGRAGDIVTCSEGLARNKLFPEGIAALATPEAEAKQKKKAQAAQDIKDSEIAKLQEQANKLDATELIIQVKIKENNELYGSITAKSISEELKSQAGVIVKPNQITGELPIKETGAYNIMISFSPDVESTMRISVEPDEESKARVNQEKE